MSQLNGSNNTKWLEGAGCSPFDNTAKSDAREEITLIKATPGGIGCADLPDEASSGLIVANVQNQIEASFQPPTAWKGANCGSPSCRSRATVGSGYRLLGKASRKTPDVFDESLYMGMTRRQSTAIHLLSGGSRVSRLPPALVGRTSGVGRRFCPWRSVAPIAVASALAVAACAGQASATTYRAGDGDSLQAAVASANASSAPSTIELTGAAFRPTSTLSISRDVTIVGPSSAPGARLDGSAVVPFPSDLLIVQAHARVTLSNVQLFSGGGEGLPAIEDSGALDIESSTVANNLGPGVLVESGATLAVRNSTISGGRNSGVVNQGTASFFSATLAFNKLGGIENKGTLNLTNTIVAENTRGGGSDCEGKAATSDHSLDSDGSCGVGALSRTDPKLGSLAANGGPTPTEALEAGSAAIGAGEESKCTAEDQRYFARPAGRCDIGAYQTGAFAGGPQSAPSGTGLGSAPSGSSALALVGVSGHGTLRGARRSRIAFKVRAEVGHARATFLYSDGARHVVLSSLTAKSLAINASRGIATLRGSGVEMPGRRRVRITVVLVSHSGHRSLRIGLSSGYYKSGSLLSGSIAFIPSVRRSS